MASHGAKSALLLDAAGTLLHPAEPVEQTYARFARPHGCERSARQIRARFAEVFSDEARLRTGDPSWRRFWRAVVARATGCDAPALVDALYGHFARAEAWRLAPHALPCLTVWRRQGLAIAVVSNWDLRLRALLGELGLSDRIDEAVISAEEGIEKPDPGLFRIACARLGVSPAAAVAVGDDAELDVQAARRAGCEGWLLGREVADFRGVGQRLGMPCAP